MCKVHGWHAGQKDGGGQQHAGRDADGGRYDDDDGRYLVTRACCLVMNDADDGGRYDDDGRCHIKSSKDNTQLASSNPSGAVTLIHDNDDT